MLDRHTPPSNDECEVVIFGPGYGESLAVHIGGGKWVLVDSCLGKHGKPASLDYLNKLGVDSRESVCLIVASHWHDDHIRGMSEVVSSCPNADFCCSAVFSRVELLSKIGAIEKGHVGRVTSGAKELVAVFDRIKTTRQCIVYGLTDKVIFGSDDCNISALSPTDSAYDRFLKSLADLVPDVGSGKRRIPVITPNECAVVMWLRFADFGILLGSDLERRGWIEIVENSKSLDLRASVFKVPHHGGISADEPRVWECSLDPKPYALIAPWKKANRFLPNDEDIRRISSRTNNAYITTSQKSMRRREKRPTMVEKTINESNILLTTMTFEDGYVRLRKKLGVEYNWVCMTHGSAVPLGSF